MKINTNLQKWFSNLTTNCPELVQDIDSYYQLNVDWFEKYMSEPEKNRLKNDCDLHVRSFGWHESMTRKKYLVTIENQKMKLIFARVIKR